MRPSILHGSVGSTLDSLPVRFVARNYKDPRKKLQSSPALHANIARCQEQEHAFWGSFTAFRFHSMPSTSIVFSSQPIQNYALVTDITY